jgi:hypothetical protein
MGRGAPSRDAIVAAPGDSAQLALDEYGGDLRRLATLVDAPDVVRLATTLVCAGLADHLDEIRSAAAG